MWMWRTLAGAIAAVALITLPASAGPPGVLVMGDNLPANVDPHQIFDVPMQVYSLNTYDNLYRYQGNPPKLEPWLAQSHTVTTDGLTWEFKLRSGVKFHDGSEITADDVAYSFKRVLAIGKAPSGAFKPVLKPENVTALDKSNGRSLWEFRTDAGVNTTVTTFDWHGDQRVVVHAGGGVFAGAARGDGIWMFSLKGTMKSLPAGGVTSGGAGFGPGRAAAPAAARPVSADHGRQLYAEACVACHGEQGDGGHGGGPTLIKGLPADSIVAVSSAGRNNMPPFGRVYTDADLRDVAAYITNVLAK